MADAVLDGLAAGQSAAGVDLGASVPDRTDPGSRAFAGAASGPGREAPAADQEQAG